MILFEGRFLQQVKVNKYSHISLLITILHNKLWEWYTRLNSWHIFKLLENLQARELSCFCGVTGSHIEVVVRKLFIYLLVSLPGPPKLSGKIVNLFCWLQQQSSRCEFNVLHTYTLLRVKTPLSPTKKINNKTKRHVLTEVLKTWFLWIEVLWLFTTKS